MGLVTADAERSLDDLALWNGFSGVVAVHRGVEAEFTKAYGEAFRGFGVLNTVDTRFALASGTKGLTAACVIGLVADGLLDLATTARSVLGRDLPLIGGDVTVGHLLAHRSGIGDYFDEDAGFDVTDHVLSVPVHTLVDTEDYLAVLDGHPAKFRPDERFCYCNGGYVVLALIASRVAGVPFHDLVQERVCVPAGMTDTAFDRTDELPERTAVGYLRAAGDRTNALHLPVRGSGDGGIFSTAADVAAFWSALFGGRIVPQQWVERMVAPVSDVPSKKRRYGLGFWLAGAGDRVLLTGYDAGVSFQTTYDPGTQLSATVVSNTTPGAWPMARQLTYLVMPDA
ncbi:serine hydrolase [Streptomyces albiflavescens]|uniref:Serine hydrolase n=1 Tax=Streptomyces albiflavescens TaxID=1623582 RepID=A0A918D8P3_9ACTN|nr:serine hydrolase domain-containing protein [Streptomyces albiflavescens]GGN81539.1 serine hydrolase [Streptomyces albiflavescens]